MNRILLSALLMTVVTVAKAQIPQQLNYQGIARNASGTPITYQTIKVRISLIDSAIGGYIAYGETRTVMTNYVGLFYIVIGSPGAASTVGRMKDVNWITGRKYIKLEIDPTGSSNFTLAGITQLQSVPYALSAASAAASGDARGDLTGTYPSPTIGNGVITSSKLANGSVSISKLDPSVASTLTNKVNVSDTSAMLSPYAKKSEIAGSQADKLNISDTATMLVPYQVSIAELGSNKLNVSDTAAMLAPYAIKTDVAAQITAAAPTFATGTLGNNINISSSGSLYTFNIPDASDTSKGLVTFTDQVFNGAKTFNSDLIVNGLTIGQGIGQNGQNTAIGHEALGSGTGTRNTAVGYVAMHNYSGTSFDNNSSFGYGNMVGLTTGNANTSVGAEAMMGLTTGSENTAIGQQSLINATGDGNTALGSGAGHDLILGYRNTFLGTSSNASINTLENATAIGYLAIVDAANTIQLGNTEVTAVNTRGKLTTGAVTYPNTDGQSGQVLTTDGGGSAFWSTASVREAADEFDALAAQTEFTLSAAPSANSKVKMYINGIRISNKAYSITDTTLTYNMANNGLYLLAATDRIQFDYSY